MSKNLAIFGGEKIIKKKFEKYNSIGSEEVLAAKSVLESGNLSQFVGSKGSDFLGGPKVQEFERECENRGRSASRNFWVCRAQRERNDAQGFL